MKDFQIDFGNLATPAAGSVDPPLYAAIDGRVDALSGEEVVFYDPVGDRNHVMTAQVLQALDLCRGFAPLDQHVRTVSEQVKGMQGQQAAVRRVLESLAARGLLITDDGFLQRFERQPEATPAPFAGLFVRACDRPAQFEALLASLDAQQARFGSTHPLSVIDASRDPQAAAAHRRLLDAHAERSGATVQLFDATRCQALVDELCGELPEAAAALRAMLLRDPDPRARNGGGLGRNLITLLAAGQRYALLDDDFLFPLRRHPEYAPGLGLDARAWATRLQPDLERALAAGEDPQSDPIELHLALCGQPLGRALGAVEGFGLDRAGLRGLAPSRLPALRPDARIAMTLNGHRGSAGASGLTWLYVLDPAGRAALLADEAAYPARRNDPSVWFGTRRFLLGREAFFTPFMVDNAALMPCTSAFGRGEDALFNVLARVAHDDAWQLDVPYAIGHRQEGRRDREALLTAPEVADVNHCFGELAAHVAGDLYAAAPGPRLALLAARFDDLAGGSDKTLTGYLREFLAYRRSLLIRQLQAVAAASTEAPAWWAADLRQLIESNGRAIIERGVPRFAGWPEHATAAECAAAFRREAQTLAAGLRAWPAAWEVALARRERWLQAA